MKCLTLSLLLQNSINSPDFMTVTAVAASNLKEQEQQQQNLTHSDKPTLKPTQLKTKQQ